MALAGGWLLYRGIRGRGRSRSEATGSDTSGTRRETDAGTTPGPTGVERSVTVGADADELYRYWRDSDLLSQIVGDFAEVGVAGESRQRWTVPTPLGPDLEWETELVEDRPGEFLHWKSAEGAMLANEGSVGFLPAPADRGTEVTLGLRFDPPGGRVGRSAMELLGVVPETLANEMLHRFKSLAETGEIPTLEKNPSGRGSGDLV